MKRLFLLLLFLSSFSLAFADSACEIDYLKFCEHQDPRIPNMCPEVLGHHLKKTCVVTTDRKEKIQKACSTELKDICRVSGGEEFISKYICLTNPEKWDKFSKSCLESLVKGNPHH